jgi:phosphatidylcholine synthase
MAAAWSVHALTATGAACGLLGIVAVSREDWTAVFFWMLVATAIDSVDGTLARMARVKEVLPGFDGALLDNIVDYLTYVIVPAYFLYASNVVPPGWNLASALAITLASAYQFCQSDAKTDDHCFKGFPSYWNVLVFYQFLLHWNPWVNLVVTLALAVCVFVPVKCLYPSRTPRLPVLNVVLCCIWAGLMITAFVMYPSGHLLPLRLSLAYIAWYWAFSAYLTFRSRTT